MRSLTFSLQHQTSPDASRLSIRTFSLSKGQITFSIDGPCSETSAEPRMAASVREEQQQCINFILFPSGCGFGQDSHALS